MEEYERIKIIYNLIRSSQVLISAGVPKTKFTLCIRESIYYVWESRISNNKRERAEFESIPAVGIEFGEGKIRYEHVVPINLIIQKILQNNSITEKKLRVNLDKYLIACVITTEEDLRLEKSGLRDKMPEGWQFGDDPFARYSKVGISFQPNTYEGRKGRPAGIKKRDAQSIGNKNNVATMEAQSVLEILKGTLERDEDLQDLINRNVLNVDSRVKNVYERIPEITLDPEHSRRALRIENFDMVIGNKEKNLRDWIEYHRLTDTMKNESVLLWFDPNNNLNSGRLKFISRLEKESNFSSNHNLVDGTLSDHQSQYCKKLEWAQLHEMGQKELKTIIEEWIKYFKGFFGI